MTTQELVRDVETAVKRLAEGNTPDRDSLLDAEYEAIADKCDELSRYLDSIAESFRIAGSPECTALLAQVCQELSKR